MTENMTFEAMLEKLQQTVKLLESGDLTLEDALKNFEEGVRLSRLCQERLNVAEQRVDLLMKSNPEVELKAFAPARS